jgi:hydroxymethylpyrimidine pyrophosphatase-like HAD family hydrolase
MEILGQYSDGSEAVTHALKLVLAYTLEVQDAETKEHLAEKYAPEVLGRKISRRKNARAVVVFDIDDTLLFDVQVASARSQNIIPHQIVVDLLLRLRQLGAEIHLVTARLHDAAYFKETEKELKTLGIVYNSLTLAPQKARVDMSSVSLWKMQIRKKIASETRGPITLTIGDQWGDMVVLTEDEQIDEYDEKFAANSVPYIVLRPADKVSLWGLKLPAYA